MNRQEAENLIYRSYLKAEQYQSYDAQDAKKRHPEFSKDILRTLSKTPAVVVTGSKGKGSVAGMIAEILGRVYSVGLMTSPHLSDFCERFKVRGVQISDEVFVAAMEAVWPAFDQIDQRIPKNQCISPMGIQAALALHWFNKEKTGFNVFECGKGARFDDVNNIRHDYAVINSIFLEHTRELGHTLEEIAADKAHVITGEQKCVYVAEQNEAVLQVIRSRAESRKVPLKIYGIDFWAENIRYMSEGMHFDVVFNGNEDCSQKKKGDMDEHAFGKAEIFKDIEIPLLGEHQAKNCALALALYRDVLSAQKNKNENGVSEMMDAAMVKSVLKSFHWPGRMEILSRNPLMILDACINRESCHHVKTVLNHLPYKQYTVIVGIPDDKDFAGVVRTMRDVAGHIILTKSQNPHYIFTKKQQEILAKENIETIYTENLESAFDCAGQYTDPLIILGTTSVVGEVEKLKK